MLSPFEWWCRNFILPDICKPCLFVFLRNLFYLTAIDGVSLIDLRQKLKDITAQQALLLDQVLEHMDDEILNAQLKAMMDEKQALQEQIAAAEQSQTHNAAQKSRMAELREWMAKLEVNQQYSDEQVRMAVERITVVDAETIRIRFRYPGAELEKKL